MLCRSRCSVHVCGLGDWSELRTEFPTLPLRLHSQELWAGIRGKETWEFQASGQRVGSEEAEAGLLGLASQPGVLPGAWTLRGLGCSWQLFLTSSWAGSLWEGRGGQQSGCFLCGAPVATRCCLVRCSGGWEGRARWAQNSIRNNQSHSAVEHLRVSGIRDAICPLKDNRRENRLREGQANEQSWAPLQGSVFNSGPLLSGPRRSPQTPRGSLVLRYPTCGSFG